LDSLSIGGWLALYSDRPTGEGLVPRTAGRGEDCETANESGLNLPPGGGVPIALPNTTGAIKARPADAGGAYALIEFSMAPGPIAGPPAHTHPHVEAFYVLEGTMDFLVGERRVRVESGGFAVVPGEVAHTFARMGTGPARFLTLFASGSSSVTSRS
jgi:quercetin dioxygenase-like cupin family protein